MSSCCIHCKFDATFPFPLYATVQFYFESQIHNHLWDIELCIIFKYLKKIKTIFGIKFVFLFLENSFSHKSMGIDLEIEVQSEDTIYKTNKNISLAFEPTVQSFNLLRATQSESRSSTFIQTTSISLIYLTQSAICTVL